MNVKALPDVPDWLVPGAEVVLYSTGGAGVPRDVRRDTIAKVTKHSFTVTGEHEPRFRIDRCSADQGGTWGWTRHVVPAGSDVARAELAGARHRRLIAKADMAYDAWRHSRDKRSLAALISVLQAIDERSGL